MRDLILKRGFARAAPADAVDGDAAEAGGARRVRRAPLTDNEVVERGLGKLGMVCLEDLVHEIHRSPNSITY